MSLSDRIARGSSKGCTCRACDAVSTYSHGLCWLCIEHAGEPHPAEDRPAVTLSPFTRRALARELAGKVVR